MYWFATETEIVLCRTREICACAAILRVQIGQVGKHTYTKELLNSANRLLRRTNVVATYGHGATQYAVDVEMGTDEPRPRGTVACGQPEPSCIISHSFASTRSQVKPPSCDENMAGGIQAFCTAYPTNSGLVAKIILAFSLPPRLLVILAYYLAFPPSPLPSRVRTHRGQCPLILPCYTRSLACTTTSQS